MSAGQGLGGVFGAIVGTIIAPGAGTFIGAGIGATLGGLIFPASAKPKRAQFETQELQFNTFEHDLPVPILFGTQLWAPNVIFIGDTYNQVEVVGSQAVASGKGEEEQEVEALVYYADFALGLCEGPIRNVKRVFRELEDISGQEGEFFTVSLGESDETVPDIVTNSPRPVTLPVPWRHTAKLLFSGRLGEANRIPRFLVEATGHDLTVEDSGVPESSIGGTVTEIYHDDVSDLLTLVTGTYSVVTVDRQGANKETAVVPNVASNAVEIAAFDGRTATLMVITEENDNLRRVFLGARNFTDADHWEQHIGTEEAFSAGISAWTVDDSAGILWTAHMSATSGMVLVGTSFHTGTQRTIEVPSGDSTGVVIRAIWYDKPWKRFYFLYSVDATLKLIRFSETDTNDVEIMEVGYGHSDPIGVCRIGELICVFDRGVSQPIHLFEFGRSVDRYTYGSLSTALSFSPGFVAGLKFRFDASAIWGLANGASVGTWVDTGGFSHSASQGASTEMPVWRQSVPSFYNRAAVEFDGVDDDLDVFANTPSLATANGCTIFMVIRPLSGASTGGQRIFSMRNTPSPVPPNNTVYTVDVLYGQMLLADNSGGSSTVNGYVGLYPLGGPAQVGVPVAVNEAAIVAIRFQQGEAKIWKNGTLSATRTFTTGFGPLALVTHNNFAFGKYVGVPNVTTESGHCNVQIADFAMYERALSDAEVEQVNDYFRAQYRIAWGVSYGTYFSAGEKLIFGSPLKFCYADGLARLIVLDRQTAGTWAIYHTHWNGDGWSVLRDADYYHRMFDEEGSAAGAIWSVLRSDRYGQEVPEHFLNRYSFERTSGFCNSPVDMRYYQNEPLFYGARFRVNYLLAANRGLQTSIAEMLTSFNGYFIYFAGQLELHADRDMGVIDGYFDATNMTDGSFGFQELAREDRWNEITVECFDAKNLYRQIPVSVIAHWERDIYSEARRKTISALGVTHPRQAGNIAWTSILGATTKRFACQFGTGSRGLFHKVGDVLSITRPEVGWINHLVQIVRIEEGESDDCLFSCVDYVPLIAESTGFPLQDPQTDTELIYGGGPGSNFQPVSEAVRVRLIENTQTGEIWLMASQPTNSGPWSRLRWHVLWNSSPTTGGTFYPGQIAFVTTAYLLLLTTTHFVPSGMLKSTITSSGTTIQVAGVCGTPPESAFDIVIFNEAITSGQFNNSNGNGMYERVQCSTYVPGTKTITVQTRGVATTAVAHTVNQVPVGAMYTRLVDTVGETTGYNDDRPVPIYYKAQTVPQTINGSHPLTTYGDEWYIGFDSSDFTSATPNGVNNIRVTVTSNYNLSGDNQDYRPTWEYSTGNGTWAPLQIESDETLGFRQSGTVAFKQPSDWVTSDRWRPATGGTNHLFPIYNNTGTAAARYYIRCRRSLAPGAGSSTPIVFGGVQGGTYPREISLEGVATNAAKGYHSPTVYFLVPNATPKYDFVSVEQGYGLYFKCQPVGVQNQSIDLGALTPISHTILNLAGE